MAQNEALGKQPTVEEEMAKFKGYSTTDGEVSNGAPTNEEKERIAADNAQRARDADVAAKNDKQRTPKVASAAESEGEVEEIPENETAEQKTAREAKAAKQASADKRIGKAVGKQRAAERALQTEREERARERGSFEARLAALEKGGLTGSKDGSKDAVDPDAPRPQDFEYGELDTKYIRAVARYEAKQELAAERKTSEAKTLTAAETAARAAFQTAKDALVVAGVEKYDDFDEVVVQTQMLPPDDPDAWPCSPTIGELILSEPQVGRDIAYHLATHIPEAKALFGKSPAAQAAWYGRMEAKFSSESPDAGATDQPVDDAATKAAAAAKVTKAPQPLKNRARGAGGNPQASADTTDFSAFEAMVNGASR